MMSESTTDRCTRVGAYFERCGGVHACLRASVVFTLCPPGLSSFFSYIQTRTRTRSRAEPSRTSLHTCSRRSSLSAGRGADSLGWEENLRRPFRGPCRGNLSSEGSGTLGLSSWADPMYFRTSSLWTDRDHCWIE